MDEVRGYQLHVLGYTLHHLLARLVESADVGDFDDTLQAVMPIIEQDLMGEVALEKEVAAVAAKMKETKHSKSMDTLELLASRVNFTTHLGDLMAPVRNRLADANSLKVRTKLETALHHIAVGLMANPAVATQDLFVFIYSTISDGVQAEEAVATAAIPLVGGSGRRVGRERPVKGAGGGAASPHTPDVAVPPNFHLVMQFALELLHMTLKRRNTSGMTAEDQVPLLDPLVPALSRGLRSRRTNITSFCLKCLCLMVPLKLPQVQAGADALCERVLAMIRNSSRTSSTLVQDGFKLLGSVIRHASEAFKLSNKQLKYILEMAFVDLEDPNNRATTFSLLKSVVARKLVVPQVYDLMTRVSEHMVRSQQAPVRDLCAQVLLMFLLDYPLTAKRLGEHLEFLVQNLAYEHAAGRLAVLQMLATIIQRFPGPVVDQWADFFFVPLVIRLVNDQDAKCRGMVGKVVKALLERADASRFARLRGYCQQWLTQRTEPELVRTAAQALGLVVEVAGPAQTNAFAEELAAPLTALLSDSPAESTLQGGEEEEMGDQTEERGNWQAWYYALLLLDKVTVMAPEKARSATYAATWRATLHGTVLLHPHLWVRKAGSRLLGRYLGLCGATGRLGEGEVCAAAGGALADMPTLMQTARNTCQQMETEMLDELQAEQVVKNLVQLARVAVARWEAGERGSTQDGAQRGGQGVPEAWGREGEEDDEDKEEEEDKAEEAISRDMQQAVEVAPVAGFILRRMGRAAANGTEVQRAGVLRHVHASSSPI
ncbi:hypothetical protein CYMTET_35392 [Cymbomonas tetramitiformis]|uniref:U3 small nucleolar RNA-associated protein 20 domain-containing protein n=1 Tax=Cymbomonas tetramitiformis TaxID=36881 RepID=A0AAE0KP85_9CHLO|nr:hypothetical protein CYMTET_35392 [Cymbomonas tetramitiformis]